MTHIVGVRRASAIASAGALVLLVAAWTTGQDDVRPPPRCTPQQTQQQAVLTTGAAATGGDGYERFCGPGVLTITRTDGGRSMTLRGQCGKIATYRRLYFGLSSNGSVSRKLGRGVALVFQPGNRSGRVKVLDGRLQPLAYEVGLTGSGTVAPDLRSGSFSVVTRGGVGPGPNKAYTGTWRCGA